MNPLKISLCIGLATVWLGLTSNASALLIGDNNDLGLIDKNFPADPYSSQGFIDILLDQPLNSGPTTIGGNTYTRTANDPLSGAYPDAVFAVDLGATTTIDLSGGYLYLLAKYDGPNWGSEIWYVGGLNGTITIPQFPTGQQYAVSHVFLFNGPARNVPDTGTTLLLFAAGFGGLILVRRFATAAAR
jgi:hypothetical protein